MAAIGVHHLDVQRRANVGVHRRLIGPDRPGPERLRQRLGGQVQGDGAGRLSQRAPESESGTQKRRYLLQRTQLEATDEHQSSWLFDRRTRDPWQGGGDLSYGRGPDRTTSM